MTITPDQLFYQLTENFKNQEAIKEHDNFVKNICTTVLYHYSCYIQNHKSVRRSDTNILCLGEPEAQMIVQALGKILDFPVLVEDASLLRATGWGSGTPVNSMISRIFQAKNRDKYKAEYCIVFLDNFDSVLKFGNSKLSPVKDLVDFINGTNITYVDSGRTLSLNTENLLFICSGAFEGSYDSSLESIIQARLAEGSGTGSENHQEIPVKNIMEYATKDDLYHYGYHVPWQLLSSITLIAATNDFAIDPRTSATKEHLIQQLTDVFYP